MNADDWDGRGAAVPSASARDRTLRLPYFFMAGFALFFYAGRPAWETLPPKTPG